MPIPPLRASRFGAADALALVFVVLVGLLNLPLPFHGDQALFNLGAVRMSEGGVLYRDFWDLKQPGIFFFYLAGGKLFGFTEVGIHLFELLYLVALSFILVVSLKRYFDHPPLTALVPLLTVGVYYGVTGSWQMTQVEGLVGFPLYLCVWLTSTLPQNPVRRNGCLFLAGVLGGIILLFKLILLPLLLAFWVAVLVEEVRRGQERFFSILARLFIPSVLGILCPVAIVLGYFASVGTLPLLFQTWFEYPPRILAELPASGSGNLVKGLLWLAGQLSPLLALGFAGAYLSLGRRKDLFTKNLILWVVVGFAVILIQRRSWWTYHYLLLLVPLGILAVRAVDILYGHFKQFADPVPTRKNLLAISLVLMLLFGHVLASIGEKGLFLALSHFSGDEGRQALFEDRFNGDYRIIRKEAAFLSEQGSRPGDIYVCGNPLYYHLSGRGQAVALNGWALELYLPEMWDRLAEQLAKARPPYLFVDVDYRDVIRTRAPIVSGVLQRNYRLLHQSQGGDWYIIDDGL